MFIFDKLDDVIAYDGTIKAGKPYQGYMKRKLKMGKIIKPAGSLYKEKFCTSAAQTLAQCTHIHEIQR